MPNDTPTSKPPRVEGLFRTAALLLLPATTLFLTTVAPVDEAKWAVAQICAPVIAGAWLIYRAARGQRLLPADPLSIAMYLGLASMLASIPLSVNPWMGLLETSKRFSVVCMFVLAATLMLKRRDRLDAVWVLVGTGLFGGVYGIAQHYGYDFFPWAGHKYSPLVRGVSFYGHATFAGSYLVLVIPLAAGLVVAQKSKVGRLIALVSLGVMLYHLSFTGARSATLGLMGAGALVFLVLAWTALTGREDSRLRIPMPWFAAGGVAAVLVCGLLVYRAWDVKESDLFAIRQVSGALRLYTWETASRLFVENPVLGIGTGNYEVVIPGHWNPAEASHFSVNGTIMHQAHNEYLETAAEQGLPGIAILIGMIVLALSYAHDAWRHAGSAVERRLALAMFGSVVAGSVDAMFIFNFQTAASAIALWAIFGLLAAQRADIFGSEAEAAEGGDEGLGEIGDVVIDREAIAAK